MSKRLYVGNLPFSVNAEKLKELFSAYGQIEEATVVIFKDTGRSKGFGFVTLTDDAQADKAQQEMNGKEIEGRQIKVNEAAPFDPDKPRERRGGFGGGRGGGGRFGGGRRPFNRSFGGRRDDRSGSSDNF
ncbi:MAG: RNA-binding protein [Nanoarchaeota archaeon]|nr:RNA-binding protein [Nanoarchaeota archaeon]